MNLLYRSISDSINVPDENSRTISGRAIVFNSLSKRLLDDKGYFYERILPDAITEELLYKSDVICNLNHDDNQMLARWHNGEGTLSLELREDGVYFSFEAPTTALGEEVLYNVRQGNLFECSFRFTLYKDDMRSYRENGERYVEITNIRGLYDVTICHHGAYGETSVWARNEDSNKVEEMDLNEYFRDLDKEEELKREEEEKKTRDAETLNALETLKNEFLESIK